MTALALAAKAGFAVIVEDLLEQGAYLNIVNKVKTRPLTFALTNDIIPSLPLLLAGQ